MMLSFTWRLEEITTSMAVFHMFTTAPEGLKLQQLHICVWDAAGNSAAFVHICNSVSSACIYPFD